LRALKDGEILLLLEELEVQELGGGDHEDVRHSSRQDPKNLENEVIPLFPRGREEDSQEGR
jgi:hypothetical protein